MAKFPIRIFQPGAEASDSLTLALRKAEAEGAVAEKMLDKQESLPAPKRYAPETGAHDAFDRLVDEDFPFDESQLTFIEGIVSQHYACGTGPAGTGKTTCTKAIVERLRDGIGSVDMANYFKSGYESEGDDDYETPELKIPSVCLVGFTGRSAQMIKKNFPRSWHGNIMTIHRMLGFMPEWYDRFDEETGNFRKSMRFVPTYTMENKLPWDIIIIDEAGMLGLELWHQVWAACRPETRIIMIGDIQQLPPVHGRSVFGFAMSRWPTFELTHVHRQEGVNNSIVDAAHAVLRGKPPVSDGPRLDLTSKDSMLAALKYAVGNKEWKFLAIRVDDEHAKASSRIRLFLEKIKGHIYDPDRDSLITAINGAPGSKAELLGQMSLNQHLALKFNQNPDRYIIDAGREQRQFAVGDRVMATQNDHEIGITNGMTGIITKIDRHSEYVDLNGRYGLITEVSARAQELADEHDEDVSIEQLEEALESQSAKDKQTAEASRGPASHVVTVHFGEADSGFDVQFATLAEVCSLMLAYAVTCHKMQGGEAPLCMSIVHQGFSNMLYREWLYTAITRSSQRHIVFYTEYGMRQALLKQKIKGVKLIDKVDEFIKLSAKGIFGAAMNVRLPDAIGEKPQGALVLRKAPTAPSQPVKLTMPAKPKEAPKETPKERFRTRTVYVFVEPVKEAVTLDGGDLQSRDIPEPAVKELPAPKTLLLGTTWTRPLALPAPVKPKPAAKPGLLALRALMKKG